MRANALRRGLKRGLFTLLENTGDKDKHGHPLWKVRCQCGVILKVRSRNLGASDHGRKGSCGAPACKKIHKAQVERLEEGPERRKDFDAAEQRIHAELAQMAARGEKVQ